MSSDVRLSRQSRQGLFAGRAFLLAGVVGLLLVAATAAQEAEPEPLPAPSPPQLNAADLEAQLKTPRESTDLDEETKKEVVAAYQQALEHVKKAADFRTKLKVLEAELAQPKVDPAPEAPDATLAQLEQKVAEQQASLEKAREGLSSLASVTDLLSTRHEPLTAIDQAFRKENIEIAFPQLDVHFHPQSQAEMEVAGESGSVRRSPVEGDG